MPTAVRLAARESYYRLIPRLEAIANGEHVEQGVVLSAGKDDKGNSLGSEYTIVEGPAKPAEQVAAANALGKVGLGEHISVEDVKARLTAQVEVLRQELGDEKAEAVIQRLSREVWKS